MIVYVAGKYSGKDYDEIEANIQTARKVAIEIWQAGHVALCPHLNTVHFEVDCKSTYKDYLEGDLQLLARCDAVVMLENWRESDGARAEQIFAYNHNIPIYYYPDIPELNRVEMLRPQQVKSFINIIMEMYRLHLKKNADYSAMNILGTGEVGLLTRTWDKMARLMSLFGFDIDISHQSYRKPSEPRCESIEDSIIDLGVYAIIWKIFRQGVWGK